MYWEYLVNRPLRLTCIDRTRRRCSAWPRRRHPPRLRAGRGRRWSPPSSAVSLQWVILPWSDMIPAAQRGRADAVLCGQGITAEREAQVDFTPPYAIFDESVLVRAG